MAIGVYRIEHIPTGQFYIGSTGDNYRRIMRHKSCLKRGVHPNKRLQAVFTSWEDMEVTFTATGTLVEARELEGNELDIHVGSPLCCNAIKLTDSPFMGKVWRGGRTGGSGKPEYQHSTETKEKIRQIRLGATMSEESKRKLSVSRSTSVSIEGVTYSSLKEAERILEIPYRTILYRVRSRTVSFKHWFFITTPEEGTSK